ncbi:hypothetical protein [Tritonibacter horizontis]|uniref:Uncharacterized protein n=1 Tax=Tritonibacter horizontis TaxID=1768241 RepID=A0A132C0D0_9RHOB|nr:hypothetical protein [Tritonibacter horizontis]KUP93792.1 hypothetical protein TRIHO_12840 [Tritonibacter horizontis]
MPDPAPTRPPAHAFRYHRDARTRGALIGLALWLLALVALWAIFHARGWTLVILALPTLPALWELWRNPVAWLVIDDHSLRWQCPRSTAEFAVPEIDHVLLVTRWDFSIRATVHSRLGTHHRIPPHVTPKAAALESALRSHGIPVKTQHFTVL